MIRSRTLIVVAGFAVLAVALALSSVATSRGRRYLDEPVRVSTETAQQAYDALRASGTRGRTLVVLDTNAHISGSGFLFDVMRQADDPSSAVAVTWGSLVGALLESGVVRKVYVVVPQADWQERSADLAKSTTTRPHGLGFVKRLDGAPVYYTESRHFQTPRERVIVLLPETRMSAYDPQFISELTSTSRADVVMTVPETAAGR